MTCDRKEPPAANAWIPCQKAIFQKFSPLISIYRKYATPQIPSFKPHNPDCYIHNGFLYECFSDLQSPIAIYTKGIGIYKDQSRNQYK